MSFEKLAGEGRRVRSGYDNYEVLESVGSNPSRGWRKISQYLPETPTMYQKVFLS
jgi:hypothetical protein